MDLTIHEVSRLLRLPVNTLERWVRQGKIPVYKSRDGYFFIERELRRWAQARGLVLSSSETHTSHHKESLGDSLTAAFKKGGVVYQVEDDTVSGVLRTLVDAAPLDDFINRDELFQKLIEREDLSSTGIGKGVAIPHPRSPLDNGPVEPGVTTCFLDTPVEYGGIDGVAVFVLFLILTPSTRVHLSILGKLSHFLRDPSFIEFLGKRPAADELLARVEAMELESEQTHP